MAYRSLKLSDLLRNAPLVCLTSAVLLSMEGFGWSYLAQTNDTLHAILMACVVSGTGLVGLVAAFVGAERRQDPRYSVRSGAWVAQVLAVLMMLPGIMLAADSIAFPAQVADVRAYLASEEHAADLLSMRQAQSHQEAADAAANLARGTIPSRAAFDLGAAIAACFLYMANMWAASALWRAKPETKTERARREARAAKSPRRPKDVRGQLKIAQ
jgi:hypothetical protein